MASRNRRKASWSARTRIQCCCEALEFRRLLTSIVVTSTADDGGSGELRAAVAQAYTAAKYGTADTITFDPSLSGQTITLTQGFVRLGLGDGNLVPTPVTIDGGNQITVSGGGTSQVFDVNSGAVAVVTGLTITRGFVDGTSGLATASGGGAIFNNGTLTLTNSIVSGSTASTATGGGLYNAGTLTVNNTTFSGNNADNGGGGIENVGTATVANSTFSANSSLGSGLFTSGGGIDNENVLSVVNSTFYENAAYDGGGIGNFGTLTVSQSTLSGNSAVSTGGSANSPAGGGIADFGDSATLLSTIVAQNGGSDGVIGPDVYSHSTSSSTNNLIGDGSDYFGATNGSSGNKVGTDASPIDPKLAPLANYGGFTQTMALKPGSPAINAGGSVTSLSAAATSSATTINLANGAAIASTNGQYVIQIGSEEMLVTAVSDNTLTVTRGYHGTTAASHSSGTGVIVHFDQTGRPRLGTADIGAFEVEGTSQVVTTASDAVNHTGVSLRDAMARADFDASNGQSDTITFSAALAGQTITLVQGTLVLQDAGSGTTTINGGGVITVGGNPNFGVFSVSSGVHASLSGLQLSGGEKNGGISGGAIYNDGTLAVANCTFSNDGFSNDGGAIYNDSAGALTITNSTFSGNSANDGGAIDNFGTATIANSTFSSNTAFEHGGAIDNDSGTLTVSNCTFSGNHGEYGGAVDNGGTLSISNCTISGNSAHNPGGGVSSNGPSLVLMNSIVAQNTDDGMGPDISADQSGGSNNLIGDGTGDGGITNGTNGNMVGTSANPIDPKLGPLANYGGATQTMALKPGSPAINAGGSITLLSAAATSSATTITVANGAAIASTNGQYIIQIGSEQMLVTTVSGNTLTVTRGYNGTTAASHTSGTGVILPFDQTGLARVGTPDIGAFEAQGTSLVVTTASDAANHTQISLRDAMQRADADASNGQSDTITFAAALAGQKITPVQGSFNLQDAGSGTTTINGGGVITLGGNSLADVFNFSSGVHALLTGLKISGEQNGGSSGGAIYNAGTLAVANCTFSNNTSQNNGGAIYSDGALTVTNSTFSGNTAYDGGAIDSDGDITIISSSFTGNSAEFGGAVENGSGGTLANSSFTSNSATSDGGAVHNWGTLSISNSTISGNSATRNGNGIYSGGPSLTLVNSIVAQNTDAGTGADISASQSRGNNNLIGDGTGDGGITNGTNGNQVGTTAAPIDPGVVSQSYNNGNSTVLALKSTSPARDAGGAIALLDGAVASTDTSIALQGNAAGIASTPASYVIKVDNEQMLVTSVDIAGEQLTVVRGYNGTTAAAHAGSAGISFAYDQIGQLRDSTPDIGAFEYQPSTTTKLTKSTSTAIKFGQSVTFTATIAAVGTNANTPSGSVTFQDGTTLLGTGAVSGGVATLTTTTIPTGSNSIEAVYSGDSNFTTSTSSALTQTVSKASTTSALTKNTTGATKFGQSVTFTAKLAAVSPGAGTPTGTVTFKDGSTTLGTATLSSGVAKFTTTALPVASNSITAVYGGDANFNTSTSSALTQTVSKASTTTALTKNTTGATKFGQSVTFTAKLAAVSPGAGTPTGTVTFKNGSTTLGTATLGSGVAKFTTTSLPVASNSITAVYGGDAEFNTSTSGALTQTVSKASTTTKLTKNTTTAIHSGQSVTFTATLAAVSPARGTPTGIVTFYDNGSTMLGTGTLSGGIATFTTTTLPVGSNSITAAYGGDTDFTTSTSSAISQTVTS